MVGVGRDLCRSSSPTPLPKQGHLQQAAQDRVQAGFEHLQRRRLPNPPGQPAPVLHHPQREEVLPHVQMELPTLQFVPIVPCPSDSLLPRHPTKQRYSPYRNYLAKRAPHTHSLFPSGRLRSREEKGSRVFFGHFFPLLEACVLLSAQTISCLLSLGISTPAALSKLKKPDSKLQTLFAAQ